MRFYLSNHKKFFFFIFYLIFFFFSLFSKHFLQLVFDFSLFVSSSSFFVSVFSQNTFYNWCLIFLYLCLLLLSLYLFFLIRYEKEFSFFFFSFLLKHLFWSKGISSFLCINHAILLF